MYTAAIMDTNPELAAAKELGIPVWERALFLGAISEAFPNAIGITGTHGKTTVTSMLTQILYGAGKDPSAVIGGKLKAIDGYGRVGASETFVYEACEFRDHFLETRPNVAVVLNIDNDHMEYFGTVANAMKSYTKFANMADTVFYNASDKNTVDAMADILAEKYTFGWDKTADFYPENIVLLDGFSRTFDLMFRGKKLSQLELSVPGKHNILNGIAAAAVSYITCQVPVEEIEKNLKEFHGAGRRFELVGKKNGITIADDYAHHPAELRAVLTAAQELGFNKVWAVFQPFTFSRTYMLLEDFADALNLADRVVLSPIMGSREVNTYGIQSSDLADKIPGCTTLGSFEEMARYVMQHAEDGDLVITLGCGDVYKCARMMVK